MEQTKTGRPVVLYSRNKNISLSLWPEIKRRATIPGQNYIQHNLQKRYQKTVKNCLKISFLTLLFLFYVETGCQNSTCPVPHPIPDFDRLSRDNDGTSVPLSQKVVLSHPVMETLGVKACCHDSFSYCSSEIIKSLPHLTLANHSKYVCF